jgi:Phosphopantetheine attachment site
MTPVRVQGPTRGGPNACATSASSNMTCWWGVVCPQAAAVLGRPSPEDIDPARAFQELGFDSVKASRLTGSKPSPSRIVTHPGL